MEFAYCFDCREITYAIADKNGVFEKAKVASNHFGHNQHIFGAPERYVPPIRMVLTKLNAGVPISANEIILFKLAIDLGEIDNFTLTKKGANFVSVSSEKNLFEV